MYREFGKEQSPEWIYRWFRGWAANYVQAVPIHASQELVQQQGGDIRIRLHLIPTLIWKIRFASLAIFAGIKLVGSATSRKYFSLIVNIFP